MQDNVTLLDQFGVKDYPKEVLVEVEGRAEEKERILFFFFG